MLVWVAFDSLSLSHSLVCLSSLMSSLPDKDPAEATKPKQNTMLSRVRRSEVFDLSKPLPADLVPSAAGTPFGKMGIYSQDTRSVSKYSKWAHYFYNPWFCLTISFFVGIRSAIIMSMPSNLSLQQKRWIYYFGDISLIMHLRYHFSILLITFAYATILVQWIHYQTSNSAGHVPWTHTRPFNVLNGRASPMQVGIHSVELLARLVDRARILIWWCSSIRLNFLWTIPIAYCLVLLYRYLQADFHTYIGLVCTCVHTFVYMFFSDFFYAITLYHMLYFYLTCEYLRIKMKQPIRDIDEFCSKRRVSKVDIIRTTQRLVLDLYLVHLEAGMYNKQFWSQIIFSMFMCFAVNVSIFSYVPIFGNLHVVVRATCFVVILTELLIFGAILYSASNVNYLSMEVYGKLNSFYSQMIFAIDLESRSKLKLDTPRIDFLLSAYRIKIQNFLGSFTLSKFGFTCGNLFMVNYWISLEVAFLMISFFLKLLQLGRF